VCERKREREKQREKGKKKKIIPRRRGCLRPRRRKEKKRKKRKKKKEKKEKKKLNRLSHCSPVAPRGVILISEHHLAVPTLSHTSIRPSAILLPPAIRPQPAALSHTVIAPCIPSRLVAVPATQLNFIRSPSKAFTVPALLQTSQPPAGRGFGGPWGDDSHFKSSTSPEMSEFGADTASHLSWRDSQHMERDTSSGVSTEQEHQNGHRSSQSHLYYTTPPAVSEAEEWPAAPSHEGHGMVGSPHSQASTGSMIDSPRSQHSESRRSVDMAVPNQSGHSDSQHMSLSERRQEKRKMKRFRSVAPLLRCPFVALVATGRSSCPRSLSLPFTLLCGGSLTLDIL